MITNDLQVIDVVYLDFVDNLVDIDADIAADIAADVAVAVAVADNYYYCIDLQVYNIVVQAK